MKLGSASVNLVSDGYLSKDGGALFGRVPKMDWEQAIKPDRRNRVKMGINLMLIQTPKYNILVDTGRIGIEINGNNFHNTWCIRIHKK